MKKKIIIFLVFILSLCIIIFIYQKYHFKVLEKCRLNLISKYEIVGEVEDILLHLNKPVSIYDIQWNVDLHKTNDDELSEIESLNIDKCLYKLFDSYRINIEFENDDIVKLENNKLVPIKTGTVNAVIQIKTSFSDNLRTPIPQFEDTIKIEIKE